MTLHNVSTTAAPTDRPDLSHLPMDVQLRIEIAETQGFCWKRERDPSGWRLEDGGVWIPDDTRRARLVGLREYVRQPAEWGLLLTVEGITVGPHPHSRPVTGWRALHDASAPPCDAPTPGRAVCLAVLAKHGRDTARYTVGR